MYWTKYGKEKMHSDNCTKNRGNPLLGAKIKWKGEEKNLRKVACWPCMLKGKYEINKFN